MNRISNQYINPESSFFVLGDRERHKDKLICSYCLRENYEDENIDIRHSSINDLFKKTYLMIKKEKNLIKVENGDNINIDFQNKDTIIMKNINSQKTILFKNCNNNPRILIKPCNCDRLIHGRCLLKMCVYSISFKCNKCDKYFNNIEFEEEIIIKENYCHPKIILLYVILLILLILSILFFSFNIKLNDTFFFWNYIIGSITLILALLIIYFIYVNWLHKHRRRISNMKLTELKKDDLLDEEKFQLSMNFRYFYRDVCQKSFSQLVEEKLNYNLYLKCADERSTKLKKYLKIYGNKYSPLNKKNLDLQINSLIENSYNTQKHNLLKHNSFKYRQSNKDNMSNVITRSRTKKPSKFLADNPESTFINLKIRKRSSDRLNLTENYSIGSLSEHNITEQKKLISTNIKNFEILSKLPKDNKIRVSNEI